ncbi:glycosyltransferase [Spirulina sp. CS-785/01]|uniref:glycosyltransferase family 2 protein n=1 Tax=Spirulina sp. CS-785/01 TaxID=3021716 RepID=UPI00232D37E8|nr:glycosyltransferase family 2 protein [Spirulina sp. CS-785/01]MDB9312724.1 glycosyltransferase [Spirulina sp. CS-785/01]
MLSSNPQQTQTRKKPKLKPKFRSSPPRPFLGRFYLATFLFISLITILTSILAAWFAQVPHMTQFFTKINSLEEQLPPWLNTLLTPHHTSSLVVIGLLGFTLVFLRLFPRPKTWTRPLIVALLLAFALRYLTWRSLSTLNLSDPINGSVSLLLFGMELFVIIAYIVQLFFMLREKDRTHEANQYEKLIQNKKYNPSVDILIPTYDEPAAILKRTIVGCQAINYSHKNIYLLDDTQRSEIEQLARELDCNYLTRPTNHHAKAGNLNHALPKTHGELILVFDADFVPTQNFITRTIGFFSNPEIGLLQTHQHFYNEDVIATNLGLEKELTHEVEIFSRHYQKLRDGAGSPLCYGSAFVLRRKALEEVGGFTTGTLSEDYFTGLRLSSLGYQVIYLDETLSAGLVAETLAGHIAQRQRWARGTLQAFFVKENPLTLSGLTLRQRISHLEGILQWFSSVARLGFLLVPFGYYFLQVLPVQTTIEEWLFFFLPYYLIQVSTFAWLNHRSRAALISDIYSVIQCVPISITVIQTLLSPFSQGFKVTPKGVSQDKFFFNWTLAWPLILVVALTAIGLGYNIQQIYNYHTNPEIIVTPEVTEKIESIKLGIIWSIYNLFTLSLALLSLLELPQTDRFPWFELRYRVRVLVGDASYTGVTEQLSEGGAVVTLRGGVNLSAGERVEVDFVGEDLRLTGQVLWSQDGVKIAFSTLSLAQERGLIELLYCQPNQWKRHDAPGELRLLGLMLRSLLSPKVLSVRKKKVSPSAR